MAPVRFTPKNAKRAIGIAKVVVPLAVPLAFQAAAFTRERWDRVRAHRLGELAAAVQAAERMPRIRRRAAHGAVSRELDLMEADLLDRLGVGVLRMGVLRN